MFDLTVEGEDEFFANEILVHNCTWSPQVDTWSPDRLDALVWAITELLIDNSPATIQSTLANPYVIR